MEKRAIVLISGGLDSALAAKILQGQGIELIGLHLLHPFLALSPGHFPAREVCREIGIPLKIISRGQEMLRLVENPRFGHGANLNPCIDCRLLEFREAQALMAETRASFIVSGEVLGQRPMSQRREILSMMDQKAGLSGLILRPLSARCLKPTLPEKEGIVDRERLFPWAGRERKRQLNLAREFGLRGFSSPAGGCLLTDPAFCVRLSDLLEQKKPLELGEVKLLKRGRHFRVDSETKLIVGRNHQENIILRAYNLTRRPYYLPDNFPGPEICVRGKNSPEIRELAGGIIYRYGKPPETRAEIREILPGGEEKIFTVTQAIDEDKLERMRI